MRVLLEVANEVFASIIDPNFDKILSNYSCSFRAVPSSHAGLGKLILTSRSAGAKTDHIRVAFSGFFSNIPYKKPQLL